MRRALCFAALHALLLCASPCSAALGDPYTRKSKRVVYRQFGDDIELNTVWDDEVELKQSDVKEGQVLVRVTNAAVNPIDLKVMKGHLSGMGWRIPMPFAMGYDFSGFVSDVGPGVSGFSEHDEVFGVNWGDGRHETPGQPVGGAFAEFIIVAASKLSKKPAGVPFAEAAAIPLVGTTAWQVLDKLEVKRDTKLLVLGGSSGVGQIAVQLGKIRGAHVATTCSGRTAANCEAHGADEVIDYERTEWHTHLHDYDAVFDAVGEEKAFEHAKEVLKKDGSFVSIARVDAGFDPKAHAPLRHAAFHMLQQSTEIQDKLIKMIAAKKLRVHIESESPFRLAGVHTALEHQERGKSTGKHVIRMPAHVEEKEGAVAVFLATPTVASLVPIVARTATAAPYAPKSVKDAWDNHLGAFGAADLDRILLDYNDASVVRVHDQASGKTDEYHGAAQVRLLFAGLFKALKPSYAAKDVGPYPVDPVVEEPNAAGFGQVLVLWRAPAAGFHRCTDTFIFGTDFKIVRQNVVVFPATPAGVKVAKKQYTMYDVAASGSKTKAGWDNHFGAFGARNVANIMKDYTATSNVRFIDLAAAAPAVASFDSEDKIKGMFTGFFAALADRAEMCAPVQITEEVGDIGVTFVVWRSPTDKIGYATDTFVYDKSGKIVRQNVVALMS